MATQDERRAELERQLAELEAEAEDDGAEIDYIDITDGDKSVRLAGKGSMDKAKRWLKTNFADLFDPDPEPEPEDGDGDGKPKPKLKAVKDPEPKRAFGRRVG